jgi:membrane-bound lytic murein transglycosylase D
MVKFPFNIKKYLLALASLSFALVALIFFVFSKKDDDRAYQDYFNSNYKIFSVNIPKDLNFCNEKVPQTDFSIKEALDREFTVNTYWQSNSLFFIKRANRWFKVIEPILKRNGVPDDIKYICAIESNFSNVISPSNAVGFWQLLEGTAKGYGLEITEEVDERYHVEKATEAACLYFKEAYKKFGNWTLAAASYNMGMGGLDAQMKVQKVNNYYDLHLNEQTARYVYRVLAIKTLMQAPQKYGFLLRKKDLYPYVPTYKLTIDSTITDLAAFAIQQGYNYKILKMFNPWLKKNTLTNTINKKYLIEFPKKEYLQTNFDELGESMITEDAKSDTMLYVKTDTSIKVNAPQFMNVNAKTNMDLVLKETNASKEMLLIWNAVGTEQDLLKLKQIKYYQFTNNNASKNDSVFDKKNQPKSK